MAWRWLLCCTSFALAAHLGVARGADDPPFPVVVASGRPAGVDRYCGLYCVHTAGRLTGREVSLDSLIRPDNLTGTYGSTVDDLLACCRRYDIPHRHSPRTSYAELWAFSGPALVLIKNGVREPQETHWVMVLEAAADLARVFDPNVGVVTLSPAEFQSLWGGTAILILPGDRSGFVGTSAWQLTRLAMLVALLGGVATLVRASQRLRHPPVLVLIYLGVGAGGLSHLVTPAGFLSDPPAVAGLLAAHGSRAVHRVDTAELAALLAEPDTVLVDARTAGQFRRSRIPGAVNIPQASPYLHKRKAVSTIGPAAHVVLYCQSDQCGWADALAQSPLLHRAGRVSVLDCGIAGYAAAGGEVAAGQPGASTP